MAKNRSLNTKYNLIMSFLYQFLSALINLYIRRLFLKHIGIEFLSFDGFFSNVIQMLCLLDFGIGTSAIYYMVKAYAANDEEEIKATYKAFNLLYKVVGLLLCIFGALVCYKIDWFVEIGNYELNFIRIIFVIIFIRTVIYYLTGTAKMALLCNQQNYINMFINIICLFAFAIVKFFVVSYSENYIFYLITILLESLSINLLAIIVFNKQTGKINVEKNRLVSKIKDIFNYGKKVALVNVNQFVFNSTDNLVINYCLGIRYIGFMSNYYLICNSVQLFATQVLESANASIYNFINDKTRKTSYDQLFNTVNFISFCIGIFCVVGLFGITDEFIGIMYGKEYVLDKGVILLMVLNIMIVLFQSPLTAFSTGAGIVNKESRYAVLVSIINLSISIICSYIIGIHGILLGTLVANMVLLVGKQKIVFGTLNMDSKKYIGNITKYIIVVVLTIGFIYYVLPSNCETIIQLLIRCIECGIIIIIDILLFFRNEGFVQTLNLIKTFLGIGKR